MKEGRELNKEAAAAQLESLQATIERTKAEFR